MTGSKVVQITNIAPQATRDQMQTLFGYLGKIDDIRLYPTIRDVACPVTSRICYVKFQDPSCVSVAQHLTNTVFIDRALIVVPYQCIEIPDEQRALELTNNGTLVPGLFPAEPKLPPDVVNQIEGMHPNQVITTHDPRFIVSGLPPYPPLPATMDARRIEEVRRTVLVSNLDESVTALQIIDLFSEVVEVKYSKFCSRDVDPLGKYCLVELTDQNNILAAFQLNGRELGGRSIQVYHATQAIVKPQAKSNEAAQREIEEAMSRVKEAQNLISAAIDPVIGMLAKEKKRSRSRSRRSRSPSHGNRRSRRSRSRSRRSSRRSRSRSRGSRSKRTRSKSREPRKVKDRSPGHSSRSIRSRSSSRRRSRSRSRRSHSKSKSKSSSSRSHDKAKESRRDRDDKRDKKDDKKETKKEVEDESKQESASADVPPPTEKSETKEKEVEKSKDKKSKESSRDKSYKSKSSRDKSRSRSPSSRSRHRSPSYKKSHDSRRRSKSPSHSSRSKRSPSKRSGSPSRSRRDEKKKEKEARRDEKEVEKDRKRREKKEEKEKEVEKVSVSKVPRNYDEEEEGFDTAEPEAKTEQADSASSHSDGDDVDRNASDDLPDEKEQDMEISTP